MQESVFVVVLVLEALTMNALAGAPHIKALNYTPYGFILLAIIAEVTIFDQSMLGHYAVLITVIIVMHLLIIRRKI